MLRNTLFVFSCVLCISIHTNGQYNYFGNYGYDSVDWSGQTGYGYESEKVSIQLYYEAFCPACREFDTTVFKQTFLELSSYLDIELHPYGNAQTTVTEYGSYEFQSQHGPGETYGNKLHACAIEELQNITTTVLFNSCLMDSSQAGQGSDDAAADVCGRALYVNSEVIKQCARSPTGSQLLKNHGDTTKSAGVKSVPTVLVNGMPASHDNFKRDVCNAFKNPPPQCRLY